MVCEDIWGKDKKDDRTDQQKQSDLDRGVADAQKLLENKSLSAKDVQKQLCTHQKELPDDST